MQRYFVCPEQIKGNRVTISGDDAHHISRVMRFHPGDEVIVCDNSGREFHVRLETFQENEVTGLITNVQTVVSEPRMRVTLAQSLLKGDKLDWIIQKSTELGVYEILPFKSERSVVRLSGTKAVKRRERWQKITKEASEQAHRGRIPVVSVPIEWQDLLDRARAFDLALIPYESERSLALTALSEILPKVASCLVIIGPEGGFTAREVAAARKAGVRSVHLGPRILRAETAALASISCMMFISGEMEGAMK